jgi:chromosome segregation ATPase
VDESYVREQDQQKVLQNRFEELQHQKDAKRELVTSKSGSLAIAEAEPSRVMRQLTSIQGALVAMEQQQKNLIKDLQSFETEQEKQNKKKVEAEKARVSILEGLELKRQTLDDREIDAATMRSRLEKSKAESHDLVTRKVELNVRKREQDSHVRFMQDQLVSAEKDCEHLKRQLKKKRVIVNSAKQLIPSLEGQLNDQQMLLRNMESERDNKHKEIKRQKDEIDGHVARLLQQEGVEESKTKVGNDNDVDDKDMDDCF